MKTLFSPLKIFIENATAWLSTLEKIVGKVENLKSIASKRSKSNPTIVNLPRIKVDGSLFLQSNSFPSRTAERSKSYPCVTPANPRLLGLFEVPIKDYCAHLYDEDGENNLRMLYTKFTLKVFLDLTGNWLYISKNYGVSKDFYVDIKEAFNEWFKIATHNDLQVYEEEIAEIKQYLK